MGIIDKILDRCDFTIPKCNQSKLLQTIEIEVNIDCNGCERRIRKVISRIDGAMKVDIDRELGKVTVEGYLDANDVLNAVKKTGKGADLWRYVPYNLVAYPYAEQVYDQNAPAGYVRDVPREFGDDQEETYNYSDLFSDENPHACCIM